MQVYFAEIHAPAAQRAAWAALERQRVPWRERYRKFARIELAGAGAVTRERLAAARRPVGLDLEIVVLGDEPIAVGQPLEFQVLRDGAPLAGFPVELVSERNTLGRLARDRCPGHAAPPVAVRRPLAAARHRPAAFG